MAAARSNPSISISTQKRSTRPKEGQGTDSTDTRGRRTEQDPEKSNGGIWLRSWLKEMAAFQQCSKRHRRQQDVQSRDGNVHIPELHTEVTAAGGAPAQSRGGDTSQARSERRPEPPKVTAAGGASAQSRGGDTSQAERRPEPPKQKKVKGPSPGNPIVWSKSKVVSNSPMALGTFQGNLKMDLLVKAMARVPSTRRMSRTQFEAHRRIFGKFASSKSSSLLIASQCKPGEGSRMGLSLVGSSAALSLVGQKGMLT